jgi:sugar phosphate permease
MPRESRIHFAWAVLAALSVCMLVAAGVRNSLGVYVRPLEQEFGWSREDLSNAGALGLFLLGAVGPWVGRLADRWGPRKVVAIGLLVQAIGTVGAAFVQSLWQMYLFSGILMSVGAGALGVSTSSAVVARWFETRRGLVLGILGAGMSAGQLLVIPLAAKLTEVAGWRHSFLYLGLGVLLLVLPLALWLVRNDPEERGLRPFGATGAAPTAAAAAAASAAGRVSVFDAARFPSFWLLLATFFVCGYTTGGIIFIHFIPHTADHGFSAMTAATAMGWMGAMNIVGTIGSGWLCDRVGRRGPLAVYYLLRGLSLIFLVYVWNAPSLYLWAAIFGLNFISTVPPTTTLTANIFGRHSAGELSGWIFFSHQVGSAIGAVLGGVIYSRTGTYDLAFFSAAALAIVAAALSLMIRDEPVRPARREAAPIAAPAG